MLIRLDHLKRHGEAIFPRTLKEISTQNVQLTLKEGEAHFTIDGRIFTQVDLNTARVDCAILAVEYIRQLSSKGS